LLTAANGSGRPGDLRHGHGAAVRRRGVSISNRGPETRQGVRGQRATCRVSRRPCQQRLDVGGLECQQRRQRPVVATRAGRCLQRMDLGRQGRLINFSNPEYPCGWSCDDPHSAKLKLAARACPRQALTANPTSIAQAKQTAGSDCRQERIPCVCRTHRSQSVAKAEDSSGVSRALPAKPPDLSCAGWDYPRSGRPCAVSGGDCTLGARRRNGERCGDDRHSAPLRPAA